MIAKKILHFWGWLATNLARIKTASLSSDHQNGQPPKDIREQLDQNKSKTLLLKLVRILAIFFISVNVLLLFIIYLPFHLLYGWSLFPYFLNSNNDFILLLFLGLVGLLLLFARYLKSLRPLLQWYNTHEADDSAPFEERQKKRMQQRLVSFVDACSIYIGMSVPIVALLNGNISIWLNPEGGVIKMGVLLIAVFSGGFTTLMVQDSLGRQLLDLRSSLGIYLSGDDSRNKRLQSSTLHLITGSIAISLLVLVFKYGIDVMHDVQSGIAIEYYQGVRFNTNFKLINILAGESLAKITNYLPTGLNYLPSVPNELLTKMLAMSALERAVYLFLNYTVVVAGGMSLLVWQTISGNENMLNFIYGCIRDILRRQRSLSSKIEVIENNEIGYLTGYFNLLLGQVVEIGQQVLNHSNIIQQVFVKLGSFIRNEHQLLVRLDSGVEQIEKQSQLQHQNNQQITTTLEELLNNVREIEGKLSRQEQMVSGISLQVAHFSKAVNTVQQLTDSAWKETLRLVSMVSNGEQAVRNSITAMRGVADSSSAIEKIVVAITKIAAQTSMLSMNAAIEAAHAGNYGSGFAVVAQEVRTLSEGASKQSRNIREEIQQLLQHVDQGLSLSESIGGTLEEINQNIQQSKDLVSLIAKAMERQTGGAKKIVWSVAAVVTSSQRIKSWTEKQDSKNKEIQINISELSRLSNAIQQDTLDMRQGIGSLRKKVDNFETSLTDSTKEMDNLMENTKVIFSEQAEIL